MDHAEYTELRRHLSAVIGAALAMVDKKVKADFGSKFTGTSEPASKALREAAADAVMQHFEVKPRELEGQGHGAKGFTPPKA